MEELWGLLVDAQNSLGGIPSAFLQDKKEEMLQAKVRGDMSSPFINIYMVMMKVGARGPPETPSGH